MSVHGMTFTTGALLAVLISGCDDPLKESEQIEETRVLGARVEVEGDPERAWPQPGETASVRWLVADPWEPSPLSWSFLACEAASVARGLPQCAEPPFAREESLVPALAEPTLTFTTPLDIDSDPTVRVVVMGVICAHGSPVLGSSWKTTRCEGDGARQLNVSLYVGVDRSGESNRNPSLTGASVELDGSIWPAPDPSTLSALSCDQVVGDIVRVAAGSGHSFSLTLPEGVREPLVGDIHPSETILVSHYTTAGDLDRPFSSIDAHEPLSSVQVPWSAPDSVAPEGLVVRFYLLVRDLRGGVDWAVRTVCVTG